MEPSYIGTINRIVVTILKDAFDGDQITINMKNGQQTVLAKTSTQGNINVYDLSCQIVNNAFISWKTNIIINNHPVKIFVSCGDYDYNDVNHMIPDYCFPAPGESCYSAYFLLSHSSEITIENIKFSLLSLHCCHRTNDYSFIN